MKLGLFISPTGLDMIIYRKLARGAYSERQCDQSILLNIFDQKLVNTHVQSYILRSVDVNFKTHMQ